MKAQSCSYAAGARLMREETAIVIPVCFPRHIDGQQAEVTLRDTLIACRDQVHDPAAVCLSVDGADFGAHLAEGVARDLGATFEERGGWAGALFVAGGVASTSVASLPVLNEI